MWAVGETCLYSKSPNGDYTFACIKDVDDVQKRLLIGSFAEDDKDEWVPMSCVLAIDNESQLLSAISAPNASAAFQELDKLFFTSKVNKALSLEDSPESWSEDENYYYAEIQEIYTETQTCNVAFLYYDNEEVVNLSDLYSHKAPEARLVTDEGNIRTAAERLISTLCDQMEGVSTEPEPVGVNEQSTSKDSTQENPPPTNAAPARNAEQRKAKPESAVVAGTSIETTMGSLAPPPYPVPLALPPNWKDLLIADQAPLQALLTSWFMCGYHTGYFEVRCPLPLSSFSYLAIPEPSCHSPGSLVGADNFYGRLNGTQKL
ncbi:unnamed protein product [Dibothriocephalus latus]|uniref:Tudor domain-containing protein n=1 Tax=Dibothriocephalus latus TaxID=60516 RepID=A0A3P6TG96_DIBLA|nr:unnamed protein product [Dibothriocephalus latus]